MNVLLINLLCILYFTSVIFMFCLYFYMDENFIFVVLTSLQLIKLLLKYVLLSTFSPVNFALQQKGFTSN